MHNDELYDIAVKRMNNRFLAGEKEEIALIEQVAETVIQDKLVPPTAMTFTVTGDGDVVLKYDNVPGVSYRIHRHAFNQLCAKVNFSVTYANQLDVSSDNEWRRMLLCYNLDELFHRPTWTERSGAPVRFLHRVVGDELRGFLSRRFNRHLASAPLLRAFIDVCRQNNARPIDATNTSVRLSLKYLLPVIFEAFPGEHVCFGTEWGNSDFGSGRLTVRSTIWRATSGTSAVLDEVFGRVHIGSVIEDSDIEMSDDTAKKEVEAQKGAITDAVTQQLQEKTIERLLKAIRLAHEEELPWGRLRPQLAKFLSKADTDWMEGVLEGKTATIIDLPSVTVAGGEHYPNAYWASACIGAIASKTEDADRKLELQKEAGRLLEHAVRGAA